MILSKENMFIKKIKGSNANLGIWRILFAIKQIPTAIFVCAAPPKFYFRP